MKQGRRRMLAMMVLLGAGWIAPATLIAQQGMRMPPATGQTKAVDQAMNLAEHSMSGVMDTILMRHMELSPTWNATKADSVRARATVKELRAAISKYRDTAAAVADGYKMFAPNMKNQRTYHFTRTANALEEAFRFNAAKPSSLLYESDAGGRMKLVGAMYTMPKRASLARLDDRIPLSIARWHKHVNWCMPAKGEQKRWLETENGMPVFGPESPIATRAGCDRVGGHFEENVFGWMVHANVFAGEDLGVIFSDHH